MVRAYGRRARRVAPPPLGGTAATGDDVVDEAAAESRCRVADIRAAWTGFRKPGWKATMKRKVLVARAVAAAAIHGSSVIGNDGSRPPKNPDDSAARATSTMCST